MSVQFEDEQYKRTTSYQGPKEKGFIGLLMKWGVAQNKAQANMIMIGISVAAIVATLIIIL